MPEKTYNQPGLPLDNEQPGDNINKEDENDKTNTNLRNFRSNRGTEKGLQRDDGLDEGPDISRNAYSGSLSSFGDTGKSLIQSKPFSELEKIDIRGEDARSPDDAARLLANFRHPRYEVFNVLYLSRENKVVGHTATTSGFPTMTAPFYKKSFQKTIDDVVKNCRDLNAVNVYIGHNHPSGDPTPTEPNDYMVSKFYEAKLTEKGINFKGQIVTDHNKYAFIRPLGERLNQGVSHSPAILRDLPEGIENYIAPERSSAPLVMNPEVMVSTFKDVFSTEESTSAYSITDSEGRLVSWKKLNPDEIQTPDDFDKIKKHLLNAGGTLAQFITNDKDVVDKFKDFTKTNQKTTYDIFTNLILVDKNTAAISKVYQNYGINYIKENYRFWETVDSRTAPVRILVNTASLESGHDLGDGGRDPRREA